jgi:hypothetical protein
LRNEPQSSHSSRVAAIHLLSASRVADELGQDQIGARQQAFYLIASLIWSVLPYYAFLIPQLSSPDPAWFWALHIYECLVVVLIYFAGTLYCLRCCTFQPERHFLKDLTWLFLPVAIVSMVVGWGLFYGVSWGSRWLLSQMTFDNDPGMWLRLLFSAKATDTLRFVTLVTVLGVTYLWTGKLLGQVAQAREVRAIAEGGRG